MSLCLNLLPPRVGGLQDQYVEPAHQAWLSMGGATEPLTVGTKNQRLWDDVICKATNLAINSANNDPIARSRCLAAGNKGSGDWLKAIPLADLGLKLSDQALSIAVGLKIGADIVGGHTCICGAQVLPNGLHGLACRHSAGRHHRHDAINDLLVRSLRAASIPATREPAGLLRSDGKRPDGVTLIPWARGLCMALDVTCPDTYAPSHLLASAEAAGSAAAEAAKKAKYSGLGGGVIFIPIAV